MRYSLQFAGEDGIARRLAGVKHTSSRHPLALLRGLTTLTTEISPPPRPRPTGSRCGRSCGDPLINPYWVFPLEEGATIERYVPAMPLSREAPHHRRLLRTLSEYRRVMGQPRQAELLEKIPADTEWMQINLSPLSGQ